MNIEDLKQGIKNNLVGVVKRKLGVRQFSGSNKYKDLYLVNFTSLVSEDKNMASPDGRFYLVDAYYVDQTSGLLCKNSPQNGNQMVTNDNGNQVSFDKVEYLPTFEVVESTLPGIDLEANVYYQAKITAKDVRTGKESFYFAKSNLPNINFTIAIRKQNAFEGEIQLVCNYNTTIGSPKCESFVVYYDKKVDTLGAVTDVSNFFEGYFLGTGISLLQNSNPELYIQA